MIPFNQCTRLIMRFLPMIMSLLYTHAFEIHHSHEHTEHSRSQSDHWIFEILYSANEFYLSQVEKILNSMNIKSEKSCREAKTGPTLAQSYGYGFLSVFIISSFSLAGAVVFPLTKKPFYKYFNAFFTSLAVGALFANSAFELLPSIIQFQPSKSVNTTDEHCNSSSTETEKGPVVPLYLWQLLMVVLVAYVFYVIEMMLNVYMNHRNRMTQDKFILKHDVNDDYAPSDSPVYRPPPSARNRTDTILSATFPNLPIVPDEKQTGVTGWMIIVGDGIHNVADGLAIGAAFADDILVGVAQSIAIAFQELPSELGEYMILIESGFKFRHALLFNFVSACTAFIGFFIGVSISENEQARTWIFAIAAGTFTYIALVDLWPQLMPDNDTEKFNWLRFACVTAGYLFGVFVMFGLGILTEEVVPKTQKK